MKLSKMFISGKDLDPKTLQLLEGYVNRKIDVNAYHQKFLEQKKFFTVENLQDYFKNLSYENALEIISYEKERKDRFLEGLADIP